MSQILAKKDQMLEYFTHKKVKKHQAEKKAHEPQTATPVESPYIAPTGTSVPIKPAPVLSPEDERFLDSIVGEEEGERPVLPARPLSGLVEAGDVTGNKSQVVIHGEGDKVENEGIVSGLKHRIVGKGKGKEVETEASVEDKDNEAKKANTGRFGFLQKTFTKKGKAPEVKPVVTAEEEEAHEKDDINKVLDDLNLSAVNNRAFSISQESQVLIQKFTVILKDLVNGVPTAYDDLTHLLDNSQETLEKSYEQLPGFLKKLIVSLPTKLTGSLAPELLAVASEAQGLNAAGASAAGSAGLGAAAKSFLTPTGLRDLVTKPGAVVSMLKAIMNALKLRWPAFMGTNVLLSLGLFVLLFVFWYCHKRGREERIKKESAVQIVDSEGRIVELDDDPMLAGPSGTPAAVTDENERPTSSSRHGTRRDERKERERKEKAALQEQK